MKKSAPTKKSALASGYSTFLGEVKSRIQQARLNAGRAVNHELVSLYWDIGRDVVQKQEIEGWGKSVVERLAKDLHTEFPDMRGFSANNIWLKRQFYTEYAQHAFLRQAAAEMRAQVSRQSILEQAVQELLARVPWGHHVELMKKVKAPAARLYYLRATAQFGWSRKVLLNQIKAGAYERAVVEKKTHNFPLALPEHLAEQADEMLKSRYNLEFLGIARPMKERELEFALKSKVNPIGVAEYQLQSSLPVEFKGRLPTAKQLAGVVREILPTAERKVGGRST